MSFWSKATFTIWTSDSHLQQACLGALMGHAEVCKHWLLWQAGMWVGPLLAAGLIAASMLLSSFKNYCFQKKKKELLLPVCQIKEGCHLLVFQVEFITLKKYDTTDRVLSFWIYVLFEIIYFWWQKEWWRVFIMKLCNMWTIFLNFSV